MEPGVFIVRLLIWIPVGILLGRKRTIGAGWGAVLCSVLGLIGLIIVLCCKKKDTPTFTDMSKGGAQ